MVVVRVLLYSVCGRRQSVVARLRGVTNVTPHFEKRIAYSDLIPKTAIGGQFGWGGTPSKGYEKCDFWISSHARPYIDGAQRSTQAGQKSAGECKSKSWPDWNCSNTNSKRESVV